LEENEILIFFDIQNPDILESDIPISMLTWHLQPFERMMWKSG